MVQSGKGRCHEEDEDEGQKRMLLSVREIRVGIMKDGYLTCILGRWRKMICHVEWTAVFNGFAFNLGKGIPKLVRKTLLAKRTELIKNFRRWCYCDDSDLVWLPGYVLRLSRDVSLSHGLCFHHLTHHSNHFNKTGIMLKRRLRGLDDTPINQAHRARLFYASDSRDWRREEANKGRKKRGPKWKEQNACVKDGLSVWLLQKSLSEDYSPPTLIRLIITCRLESQTRTCTCRAYSVRIRAVQDGPLAF